MSHVFTVLSCGYDGTTGGSGDPNPICWLQGTVDGVQTNHIAVYYDTIMQASLVGGPSAVQNVLAPILLSALRFATPPFPQVPAYSAAVPPASQGSKSVSVAAALVPQWTQ
jgi:hypothetical protein